MLLRSHALRSALRGAARIAPHRYGALRACSASADAGHQGGPTVLYEAAVARNEISADEDQVAALRLLQRVHNDIAQALAEGNEPRADAAAVRSDGAAASSSSDGGSDGGGGGWFSSLFGAGKSNRLSSSVARRPTVSGRSSMYLRSHRVVRPAYAKTRRSNSAKMTGTCGTSGAQKKRGQQPARV